MARAAGCEAVPHGLPGQPSHWIHQDKCQSAVPTLHLFVNMLLCEEVQAE